MGTSCGGGVEEIPIVDEGSGYVWAEGCGCRAREATSGIEEGGHLGQQEKKGRWKMGRDKG